MLTYYTHIFSATALSKVLFDGGYVEVTSAARTYMFFLTDHLGSVRVVTDENGTVRQVNQYYPYGDPISDSRREYPILFDGKYLKNEKFYDYLVRLIGSHDKIWKIRDSGGTHFSFLILGVHFYT